MGVPRTVPGGGLGWGSLAGSPPGDSGPGLELLRDVPPGWVKRIRQKGWGCRVGLRSLRDRFVEETGVLYEPGGGRD